MKRAIILLSLLIFGANAAHAQIFLGAGADYSIPNGEFSDTNGETYGINFQLESRVYCNVWYGFRIEYFAHDAVEDLAEGVDYFEETICLSPEVRYNFFHKNRYDNFFLPFARAQLTLSSAERTEDLTNKLGVGGAVGAGFAFPIRFLGYCWTLDLGADYSAPNFIFKDDERPTIETLNLYFTLNIGMNSFYK